MDIINFGDDISDDNIIMLLNDTVLEIGENNLLHYFSYHNRIKCVKYLIDVMGVNVNSRGANEVSALFLACQEGHLTLVRYLLQAGAEIDSSLNCGATPIYVAAERGWVSVVRFLVQNGANLKKGNIDGHHPLHVAAQNNHSEIIRILVENGEDIECTTKQKATPLFIAAYEGHYNAIDTLIKLGANLEAPNIEGVTSLFVSSERGNSNVTRLLLSVGADVGVTRTDGFTSIHQAAQNGHDEVVRLLVEQTGCDIDICTKHKASACFIAAYQGHYDVVNTLVTKGANIDLKTDQNVSCLFVAAELAHINIVRLLLENDAELDIIRDDGVDLVHIAARHIDVLRLILEKGANIAENAIADIHNEESKNLITEEIDNRKKRIDFDQFVNHYVEYLPYKNIIYSKCYPKDLRIAKPINGWNIAFEIRKEYYFKEIFFYLELYISKINSRKVIGNSKSLIQYLAKHNDKTHTLLTVLSDRLIDYLKPT